MGIDQVQLNFSPATLMMMNILIGFILFGVALDLKPSDFKRVLVTPEARLDRIKRTVSFAAGFYVFACDNHTTPAQHCFRNVFGCRLPGRKSFEFFNLFRERKCSIIHHDVRHFNSPGHCDDTAEHHALGFIIQTDP